MRGDCLVSLMMVPDVWKQLEMGTHCREKKRSRQGGGSLLERRSKDQKAAGKEQAHSQPLTDRAACHRELVCRVPALAPQSRGWKGESELSDVHFITSRERLKKSHGGEPDGTPGQEHPRLPIHCGNHLTFT